MALIPFSHATSWEMALRLPERYFDDVARAAGSTPVRVRIVQRWEAGGKGGTELGFGASVYPAAIVLSAHVGQRESFFGGKRVIELGCGCALVSVSAAIAGASLVVATDGDPACVDLAAENASINNVDVQTKVLYWGSKKDHDLIDASFPAFDFVLASDVAAFVYGTEAMNSLVQTLVHLASRAPNVEVLLSFKRRDASIEGSFWKLIHDSFESVEYLPHTCMHSDFRDDPTVGIARIRRPRSQATLI